MPKSTLGKWSVGLIPAMLLCFVVGSFFASTIYQFVPAGETVAADIIARPGVALVMLAGMGAGISAFIVGLLAFIKMEEKSLLVGVSTTIGMLLILFLVGEMIFPH